MPERVLRKSTRGRASSFVPSLRLHSCCAERSDSVDASVVNQSSVCCPVIASLAGFGLRSGLRRRLCLLRRAGNTHTHQEEAETLAQRIEHAHRCNSFPIRSVLVCSWWLQWPDRAKPVLILLRRRDKAEGLRSRRRLPAQDIDSSRGQR